MRTKSPQPPQAGRAADRIYRFLLASQTVRGVLLIGTAMIRRMRRQHGLGILETLVLGHGYLATGLLSANLKGDEKISLLVDCSGPIKGMVVEANGQGAVRGYLKQVPIPLDRPLESPDLSRFYGAGFLTVIHYLPEARQPFTGKVILEYGNLAKDMANYYLQSEQLPTSFHLSIHFAATGEVTGAAGLFLQAMPGVQEGDIVQLAADVESLPSLGRYFSGPATAADFIDQTFSSYQPEIIGSPQPVSFRCSCSRERMFEYLKVLPGNDRAAIRENGPFPLEIICHYCNTAHLFNQDILQEL